MKDTKRHFSRLLSLILILTLVLGLSFSVSALSATADESLGGQDGDPLRIDVYDNGRLGLFFWQLDPYDPSAPLSYINQYYGNWAWGSNIFLTDGATLNRFSSDYATGYDSPAGTINSDIGLGAIAVAGNTVTTTWSLHAGELEFVQTITYTPGSYYFEKKFSLTNLSDRTFTDMKFIHGGDTYFGGNDAARSYWNDVTRMIYVKNNNTTDFGLMGFYGSLSTPADRYYAGSYYTGNQFAASGVLPNTADESYRDAGYQLQWNKADLAADETWTITSYEQITEPSDIQILAPAEQTVARGATASYNFMVQNFTADTAIFNLTALSEHGWPVVIEEGASVTIAGNGSYQIVHVAVDVPADANLGDTDILTLAAVQADNDAVTAEGGTRTVVDEDFPSIESVTPSATEFFTDATSLGVAVTTNNVPDGSEVVVTLLDADKNPLDVNVAAIGLISAGAIVPAGANVYHVGFEGVPVPAPEVSEGAPAKAEEPAQASDPVIASGISLQSILPGTADLTLALPGDLAPGTYYLSVAITGLDLKDDSTSVEAIAALPVTGEPAPWQPITAGIALLVLAGGACLIRRRISNKDPAR